MIRRPGRGEEACPSAVAGVEPDPLAAGPYVAAAIDHGQSFDRWLTQVWRCGARERVRVKSFIVHVCLDVGTSGIVVGDDLEPLLPRIAARCDRVGADLWLGGPDTILGRLPASGRKTTWDQIESAAAVGARGVKLGLGVGPGITWERWEEELEGVIARAERRGVDLVVEPYFRREDLPEDRARFLSYLDRQDRVAYAKLDVEDPKRWSHVYGGACASWLARSDGLDHATFTRGVSASVAHGCRGSMVGRAVWGVEIDPSTSRDAYASELARRLAALRAPALPRELGMV